ncbi:hypothetical protein NL676_039691 [Syzygium grande]|nr:hypothetical protein NL676_039691 [Syzygium grande]
MTVLERSRERLSELRGDVEEDKVSSDHRIGTVTGEPPPRPFPGIKATRASQSRTVCLGTFTAAFYGLQNLLAEKQGVHDVFNIAGAGSATAATFGSISGSLKWCARNVAPGAALGAAVCFPLGWSHLKLVEKANGVWLFPVVWIKGERRGLVGVLQSRGLKRT